MYYKGKTAIISIPNMGYTKSFIKGISWVSAFRIFFRFFSFIKIVILARILTPDQFGVFAIAYLVYGISDVFTETGVDIFLVQSKETLHKYLDSAWIVSMIRGLMMFLFIIIAAPFVSYFFHSKESLNLILLISIIPLIQGLINPAEANFQKELLFKNEFFFRSFISAIEVLVTIIIVLILKSPAGLVYGLIFGVLLEMIMSHILINPKPKLKVNREHINLFFHRGQWITYSGIFDYLYRNIDNIMVGRILGTSALGLYDVMYKISMLPITEVTDVVSRVSFPVYVKLTGDAKRLKKAFLKTTLGIFLIVFPLGIVLFLFPKQIINFVFGPKWVSGSVLLQVLAGFGIVRALSNSTSAMFMALTKQKYAAILSLVSFGILFITIIPLIGKFGLVGAAYSVVISSFVVLVLTVIFLAKAFKENEEFINAKQ